jgi:Glycosyl transferase family 2
MVEFPRVRYCATAPSWSRTREAEVPWFLAPPRMRCAWPLLARRAAGRAAVIAAATRSGADLRTALRFLLWLDTARCFGIEELERTDQLSAVLTRHLPPPADQPDVNPGPVTGVVIAKDEEQRLAGALRSLEPFVDEMVVVDDHSTDATAQVAKDLGARVLRRRLQANFAEQKNAGVAAARTDWVVCIDADERLEPGLIPILRQAMAWPDADAVFVPLLCLIMERGEAPVDWPDVQARVFRAHLRYRGAVHEVVDGWRRPMYAPLSGPYIRHEKTLFSQHRSTLLYSQIDPSPYTEEEIASVKEEMTRLERDDSA